ncbi:MAG: ATP synthase subunit I [Myxococcota bacterium]|nr:ATP synthase subunit I [Myxococcota bacterium]
MREIYKRSFLLGFALILGSLYFRSWSISLGVSAGIILAIVNLWLIQRAVGGLLAGERASIGWLYVFKLTVLLALLFVLIGVLGLNAIALVTGFSVLFLVISTGGAKAIGQDEQDTAEGVEVESEHG